MPALAQARHAELAAGCDPDPDRRGWFDSATGLSSHPGVEAMLAAERVDAVVVATPPAHHVAACLHALGAGVAVMCEKPLAPTREQAAELVEAAQRSELPLAVNHSLREAPIFAAIRSAIASGEHGELRFVELRQLMDLPPAAEPTPWRAAAPDAALLEAGIHLADLLVHLYGAAPEAVYARRGAEDDALVVMTVEFPGGRLGQLTINRLTTAATRYAELRADCAQASLRASWGGRALARIGKKRAERAGLRLEFGSGGLAWVERGRERRTLARNPRRPAVHGTARLLDGLAAAVRNGGEPPSSGREALETLALVEAAYRSAATGRRVPLDGLNQ